MSYSPTPKHRFRIVGASGYVYATATKLGVAERRRDAMADSSNHKFPNLLMIQCWSCTEWCWKTPTQMAGEIPKSYL